MKKIKLSLSPEYCLHWGVNDALRELYQNAIDNGKWESTYDADNQRLTIVSHDTVLDKKTLLLGKSTKDGKDTIGQFGEGYKIALLVLLRNGNPVTISTGDEIWKPKYAMDPILQCKSLRVDILENTKFPTQDVIIKINRMTKDVYDRYKKNNLNLLDEYPKHIESNTGKLIRDTHYVGKVFVGGLFINKIAGFEWGYDFNPGQIDIGRDRNIVAEWDVKYNGRKMIEKFAKIDPEEVVRVAEAKGCAADLSYMSHIDSEAKEKIAVVMLEKYDDERMYFVDDSRKKPYDGIPIVLNDTLYGTIENTAAYKERIENLDKIDIVTADSLMMKWIEENREYMGKKAIESFENYLIPAIKKVK